VKRSVVCAKKATHQAAGRTNQGCHMAFLKLFIRNEIVWPFLNIKEKNTDSI